MLQTEPNILGSNDKQRFASFGFFLRMLTMYRAPFSPLSSHSHLFLHEDNDAVIRLIMKGSSPNLRRVVRTFRVNLDWLCERFLWIPLPVLAMLTRVSKWQMR